MYHPTEKPIKLLELLINESSDEGDIILDCFAGSGTTGIACKNTNRNCILIEKETIYIDIIKERLT
jgi:site-specific DNA-methyltransferase (adenine-specific)